MENQKSPERNTTSESVNLNDLFEGARSGWTQRAVQEGINGKDLLCSATASQDLELMHWLQSAQKAGPGTAAPLASPLSGTDASAQPHSEPGEPSSTRGPQQMEPAERISAVGDQAAASQKAASCHTQALGVLEKHCLVVPCSPPSLLLLRACSGSAPLSLPHQ